MYPVIKKTLKNNYSSYVCAYIRFCFVFNLIKRFETLRQICDKKRIVKHIRLQCALKVLGEGGYRPITLYSAMKKATISENNAITTRPTHTRSIEKRHFFFLTKRLK